MTVMPMTLTDCSPYVIHRILTYCEVNEQKALNGTCRTLHDHTQTFWHDRATAVCTLHKTVGWLHQLPPPRGNAPLALLRSARSEWVLAVGGSGPEDLKATNQLIFNLDTNFMLDALKRLAAGRSLNRQLAISAQEILNSRFPHSNEPEEIMIERMASIANPSSARTPLRYFASLASNTMYATFQGDRLFT